MRGHDEPAIRIRPMHNPQDSVAKRRDLLVGARQCGILGIRHGQVRSGNRSFEVGAKDPSPFYLIRDVLAEPDHLPSKEDRRKWPLRGLPPGATVHRTNSIWERPRRPPTAAASAANPQAATFFRCGAIANGAS